MFLRPLECGTASYAPRGANVKGNDGESLRLTFAPRSYTVGSMNTLADLLVAARGPLTTAEVARRAALSIRSIQLWESGRLPARASLGRLMRACRCESAARAVIVAAWEKQKAAAHAARRARA